MTQHLRWPALIILACGGALALAQPATTAPAPAQPAGTVPKDPRAPKGSERDPKAVEALTKAAEGMMITKWLSYAASIEGPGNVGTQTFDVVAERADAGGWKLSVKGEIKTSRNPNAKGRPVHVAYDGATARSLRETDKEIGELADPPSLDDVRAFFAKERAAGAVPWEFMGETPMSLFASATIRHEGTQVLDGVECEVVRVSAPPGPDTKGIEPTDGFGGRYFIDTKDKMVRKIERFRPNARPDDKPVRTFTLAKLEFDEKTRGGDFVINPPKGFTVRQEARRPAPKPIDRAREEVKKPAASDNGLLANGTTAPDFSLKTPDGDTVKLADQKGKVVVLDFWATWCGPCLASMPTVQKLHEKYKDRGVVIMGLHTDPRTDKDAEKVKKGRGADYMLLLGASKVSDEYKVRGIPTFYVIDKQGKISHSQVGAGNLEKALGDAIEAALK